MACDLRPARAVSNPSDKSTPHSRFTTQKKALALADQAPSRYPEAARILLRAPPGMEAQLSFMPRISCQRDADHPPSLLTAQAAELMVRAARGASTLCKSYTGDALVKPFFDSLTVTSRRYSSTILTPPGYLTRARNLRRRLPRDFSTRCLLTVFS